ncbi:Ankyrin repeat region domain-containing protein [Forsythia ovata]|uniref:Ankyrin repeat region domain-containing protein n=1 Tax=Forsythia ovata TaxID=205694 RepID=A0ABD1S1T0_9LAMI
MFVETFLLLDDSEIGKLLRSPSRPLFVAAEFGNFQFIRELILSYPDLIWKVNEQSRNALALFSSVTSILMFLSILTSRYAEEDFLQVFVEEADYWPNNTLLFYSIDAYSFQCKLFHCSWSSSGMDYCPSCSHCLHSNEAQGA